MCLIYSFIAYCNDGIGVQNIQLLCRAIEGDLIQHYTLELIPHQRHSVEFSRRRAHLRLHVFFQRRMYLCPVKSTNHEISKIQQCTHVSLSNNIVFSNLGYGNYTEMKSLYFNVGIMEWMLSPILSDLCLLFSSRAVQPHQAHIDYSMLHKFK